MSFGWISIYLSKSSGVLHVLKYIAPFLYYGVCYLQHNFLLSELNALVCNTFTLSFVCFNVV